MEYVGTRRGGQRIKGESSRSIVAWIVNEGVKREKMGIDRMELEISLNLAIECCGTDMGLWGRLCGCWLQPGEFGTDVVSVV